MIKIKSLVLGFALSLTGCMSAPHTAYDVNNPKTEPVRNLTRMDTALACLDKLLVDYKVSPIYIGSVGIPNRAGGKVDLNSGDDMLKTSIGQLFKSNVFHFIDLASLAMSQMGTNAGEQGSRPTDIQAILQWIAFLKTLPHQVDFTLPEYVISGSISQLDNNALSDSTSGSVGSDQLGSIGASQDQMVSVATVDMQVMDSKTREIINGLTTKNSLAIVKTGTGMDISGRIKTVGGSFNVSYDKSEGLHQGIRDLIELSTIELLGRLAHVPYQQCLGLQAASSAGLVADNNQFEDMNNEQRVREVQNYLAKTIDNNSLTPAPFYQGSSHGQLDENTRNAIANYQRYAGLIANGQINSELLRSLKNPPATITASHHNESNNVALTFQLKDGRVLDSNFTFPRNSELVLGLISNQNSHAHCFLKNQDNEVYRIFPTTEQANDKLTAGQVTFMPTGSNTHITLDTPTDNEEVGCLVSTQPLNAGQKIPLTPLGTKPVANVKSLQEVLELYRKADTNSAINLKVLRFDVQ